MGQKLSRITYRRTPHGWTVWPRWRDPPVTALMENITTRSDSRWNRRAPGAFPCTFRIRMRDGHEFCADVCGPVGVSATIVTEKFHATISGILSREARQGIVDAIMELHHSRSTAARDAAITAGEIR